MLDINKVQFISMTHQIYNIIWIQEFSIPNITIIHDGNRQPFPVKSWKPYIKKIASDCQPGHIIKFALQFSE